MSEFEPAAKSKDAEVQKFASETLLHRVEQDAPAVLRGRAAPEPEALVHRDRVVRRVHREPSGVAAFATFQCRRVPQSSADTAALKRPGDEEVIEVSVVADADEADDFAIDFGDAIAKPVCKELRDRALVVLRQEGCSRGRRELVHDEGLCQLS